MLTAFDYAVLSVIGLSALRGAWRGLIAEAFGLIGWIAAFLIACHYVGQVALYIPADWPGGVVTQWVVAFALLMIGVVLVAGVMNALLSRFVQVTGFGGIDRSLGLIFGFVRGLLLVLLFAILAGLTELPRQDFWRAALLRPWVERGVHALKPQLPPKLAAYVRI